MTSVQTISLAKLAIGFLPVLVVLGIYLRWSLGVKQAAYAVGRMLVQLLLIGYALNFIFAADHALVVVGVLVVMTCAASWIALGTVQAYRPVLLPRVVVAMLVGGGSTLFVVSEGVLVLEPWYHPQYLVPLAGMVFANAMNSVSLAAERFFSEKAAGHAYEQARIMAFRAGMIPVVNSLLAVGLVSLPGMMTGQILSGVSPLVAARYQIVVMCMIFGSAGMATACFLLLARKVSLQKNSPV